MNIILDRDGTIIEDRHYLSDPDDLVLLPNVVESLKVLAHYGCQFFLVSNQSGIGRGYFSEDAVLACQHRLDTLLAEHNLFLQDSVWCPHAPEEHCTCRKPQIGLWKKLQLKYNLNPTESLMIGDKIQDIAFAVNAHLAAGFLVLTGHGEEECHNIKWTLPQQNKGFFERQAQNKCRIFIAKNIAEVVKALQETFKMV